MNKELERYFPIAEMLGKTFGRHCEVVIHDLSVPQNSVVYTINNQVTGRTIGQPFDHLVKQVLLSKNFNQEYAANYTIHEHDGRQIKASTVLLRNSAGMVIGAMCINLDVTAIKDYSSFITDMLFTEPEEPTPDTPDEMIPEKHINDIVIDIIDKIVGNTPPNEFERQERLNIIAFMDSRGLFLVKGAVDRIAEKLGISRVTVYSYLEEVRKNNHSAET